MKIAIKNILSSMRGAFLPYRGDNSLIPGGRVRLDDMSYYGIYNDKRQMRGDLSRFAHNFNEAVNEAKETFKNQ